MNMELFFKKVYTVAFRLTGEENAAAEMATLAITHTIEDANESNITRSNSFQSTILELMRIFLSNPSIDCNDNITGVQCALLKLKPIKRSVIVWKDVLGYKVSDNTPVADYSCDELLGELCCGRKELKDYLKHENVAEMYKPIH